MATSPSSSAWISLLGAAKLPYCCLMAVWLKNDGGGHNKPLGQFSRVLIPAVTLLRKLAEILCS